MITGKYVRLRAIEREDIQRFTRWVNDPDVIKYTTLNAPISLAMEEKWFDQQVETAPTKSQVLAVEARVGNDWVHIGACDLRAIEPVNRAAEFGIMIGDKAHWNEGFGTETVKLMLKHGFEDLNLNRIYLYVVAEHSRGIKAYEAAGFKKEGVLRQALYKNGVYNDVVLMSVLHSEWKGFES